MPTNRQSIDATQRAAVITAKLIPHGTTKRIAVDAIQRTPLVDAKHGTASIADQSTAHTAQCATIITSKLIPLWAAKPATNSLSVESADGASIHAAKP